MLVYLGTFVLSFLGTYFAETFFHKYKDDKKIKNLLYFVLIVFGIFIILTFVNSTRYGIGIDYNFSDKENLKLYREGKPLIVSDLLPVLLIKFVVNNGLPDEIYFLIFGIFTTLFYVLTVFMDKKGNFMPRMFVFLIYCLYISSFNQMRQSAGIALGMFALCLTFTFYPKWYVIVISYILCGISMLFHSSEIINVAILTIYLIVRALNNKIKMKYAIIFSFIMIALTPLLFIALKYTIDYIPILNKYAHYLHEVDNSTATVWKILGSIFMFVVPMFTYILCLLRFSKDEDYQMKLIFIYFACNLCFMIVALIQNNLMIADRTRTMIYGLELFIFPYLLNKFNNEEGKIKLVYKYGALLLMMAVGLGTLFAAELYPYYSIFGKDIPIY